MRIVLGREEIRGVERNVHVLARVLFVLRSRVLQTANNDRNIEDSSAA